MAAQPPARTEVALSGHPTAEWLTGVLPALLATLPAQQLRRQRWFGSKAQAIAGLRLHDVAPLAAEPAAVLALVDVALAEGTTETYHVPLAVRPLDEATAVLEGDMSRAFLHLATPAGDWLLYDALADSACGRVLFRRMETSARLRGASGEFAFGHTPALAGGSPLADVRRLKGEQSNTSVVFDDAFVLKAYRKLQNGPNPDLEVPRFLTASGRFPHSPPVAGYFEYEGDGFAAALGSLQAFVANGGDGWAYTLAHLRHLYDHVAALQPAGSAPDAAAAEALAASFSAGYLRDIRRLGEITAEMHNVLAAGGSDPAFAPEPVTADDLERWVGAMEAQLATALRLAKSAAGDYAESTRAGLSRLAASEDQFRARLAALGRLASGSVAKIRHHGDYHLGQVLRTADGFVVIDFEGEPARSLAERRAKHLALRDVAGMLRSFNYAVYAGLVAHPDQAHRAALEALGLAWELQAAAAFVEGYLLQTHGTDATFLPPNAEQLELVLDVLTLDKAIYELIYELNNRPDWVPIPLAYILGTQAQD